jgi:hypothetical protein
VKLWLVTWPQGARKERATYLVPHRGAAFDWLVRQRPWLLPVAEHVDVEAYAAAFRHS